MAVVPAIVWRYYRVQVVPANKWRYVNSREGVFDVLEDWIFLRSGSTVVLLTVVPCLFFVRESASDRYC